MEGQAAPQLRAVAGLGYSKLSDAERFGIQALRRGRCLRMRSWLGEAEQAVRDQYVVSEDFCYVAGLLDQEV